MAGAVLDQRFVDERTVVVRVDATDVERQPPPDGLQSVHNPGLLRGQKGNGFGPAGADVGGDQAMNDLDRGPPQ